MKSWMDLSSGAKTVILSIGGIALAITGTLALLREVAPIAPVTYTAFPTEFNKMISAWATVPPPDKGLPFYYGELAKPYIAEREKALKSLDEKFQLVADQAESKFGMLTKQINESTIQLTDTKITVLEGQLRTSRRELVEWELRNKDAPNDDLIVDRLIQVRADIAELERSLAQAQCELLVAKGVREPSSCR